MPLRHLDWGKCELSIRGPSLFVMLADYNEKPHWFDTAELVVRRREIASPVRFSPKRLSQAFAFLVFQALENSPL